MAGPELLIVLFIVIFPVVGFLISRTKGRPVLGAAWILSQRRRMDHHRSGPSTVLIRSARTIVRGDHAYENDGLADTDRHLTVRGLRWSQDVSMRRSTSAESGTRAITCRYSPLCGGPVAP